MIRSMTLVVIGLSSLLSGVACLAQDQKPAAPDSKDLEIVNEAKIAVMLFPAHRSNGGLVDPPEEITLKPGQSAHLRVRADWKGDLGVIDFLPVFAVREGGAFPYGMAAYTPAKLRTRITDDSIPDPDRDRKDRHGKKEEKQREANPAGAKVPVPYPHPLITEVLYAVPSGAGGDANRDGTRDTNGDEFVELVNPHDRAINLRGYTISGKPPASSSPGKAFTVLKFVFPSCELAPGEVAVVFNGHGATWSGPVGDTTHAAGPNPAFCGARVFTMKVESARLGFANKADEVLLTAPGGEAVECVKWGDIKPPANCKLVETAPEVSGQSVFRRTVDGPLEPHPSLEGFRFSPGRFPLDAAVPPMPKPETTNQPPAPKPPEKQNHPARSGSGK